MKKFELTANIRMKYGRKLTQIKAAISFGFVKKGDLGGWVENESSLHDDVWIYENAEVFSDAVIRGGEIRGGEIWGGVIRGGEIRGGEIRGGEIWGGEIRGGEIWGGVIRGGVIRGGVIKKTSDYIAFSSIGSDGGVLTAYIANGEIELTRGCFRGTLKDFEDAVKKKHGKNEFSKEYGLAIQIIKLRFDATIKVLRKKKAE